MSDIKLNQTQLRSIIKETIVRVLNESQDKYFGFGGRVVYSILKNYSAGRISKELFLEYMENLEVKDFKKFLEIIHVKGSELGPR